MRLMSLIQYLVMELANKIIWRQVFRRKVLKLGICFKFCIYIAHQNRPNILQASAK